MADGLVMKLPTLGSPVWRMSLRLSFEAGPGGLVRKRSFFPVEEDVTEVRSDMLSPRKMS